MLTTCCFRLMSQDDAVIDCLVTEVEADSVIARREDDAFHPVTTGSLEDVVAADDVGLQDVLPWPFDRVPAEVHDRVDGTCH